MADPVDVNFDCPQCGQNIDAPADMVGASIECPACEQSISIPGGPLKEAPKVTRTSGGKKVIVKKRGRPIRTQAGAGKRPAAGQAAPQVAAPVPAAPTPVQATAPQEPALTVPDEPISKKTRLAAMLFCLFLGGWGGHRFYVGKVGTAVAQIFTCGGFGGVWPFIDLILILSGKFRDEHGRRIFWW